MKAAGCLWGAGEIVPLPDEFCGQKMPIAAVTASCLTVHDRPSTPPTPSAEHSELIDMGGTTLLPKSL